MVAVKSLEHFFKPEVRKQGEKYYDEDAVYLSAASDTSIAAIIKASPPIRIAFSAESISDAGFKASCSCTSFAKGQLCKHIWATALTVALEYPDFFDSKVDIEKVEIGAKEKKGSRVPASQQDFQSKLKAKQSVYRKQQYQKLKTAKKASKDRATLSRQTYADDVEGALKYFSKNGFELETPIKIEILRKAKTILSRVFHPDKGGSHQEMIELNKNFETILRYLG